MKRTLVLILAALLFAALPAKAGWFSSKEEKLLIEAYQRLDQEQQRTGTWQIVSGILAIGCVSLLVFGTALGSKVRRARSEEESVLPVFHENSPAGEP